MGFILQRPLMYVENIAVKDWTQTLKWAALKFILISWTLTFIVPLYFAVTVCWLRKDSKLIRRRWCSQSFCSKQLNINRNPRLGSIGKLLCVILLSFHLLMNAGPKVHMIWTIWYETKVSVRGWFRIRPVTNSDLVQPDD